MKLTVKIQVVASDRCSSDMPTVLEWTHEQAVGGDNPRFYGDAVQRAIRNAADAAIDGANVYVDLRA